jgi:very-short-patch-repair endonuclease
MNYTIWNLAEVKLLEDLFINKGIRRKEIAKLMNKSESGIAKKIKTLKLKRPIELKTIIRSEASSGENNGMFGKKSWCKGLTKETNEIIKEKSKKTSNTRIELFKSGILDNSGENNGMFGKKSWNGGRTKDNDIRLKKLGEKSQKTKKERWGKMSTFERAIKLEQLHQARKKCKNRKNSWIEIFIEKLLLENHIEFKKQKSMGYFIMDFYIPKNNLVIECQGDYWHANPIKYSILNYSETQRKNVERDKRKKEYLEKNNIQGIFIWEKDIRESPQKIISQILSLTN